MTEIIREYKTPITPRSLLTHKKAREEVGRMYKGECCCCGKIRVLYYWVEGECLECIKIWEFGCE